MEPIEPSYLKKLRRAERHAEELILAIQAYGDAHPYRLDQLTPPASHRWKLVFSARPENTDIPLVAADLLYNLRSALDHLACALNPPDRRRRVYFPIYFRGVWDPPVAGEGTDRKRARERWAYETEKIHPEAVAVLRRLQPRDDAPDPDPTISFLRALHILSRIDRHQSLPFLAPALQEVEVTCTDIAGNKLPGAVLDPGRDLVAYQEGAELSAPRGTAMATIRGRATVALEVYGPESSLKLGPAMEELITKVREFVVAPLLPYVVPA